MGVGGVGASAVQGAAHAGALNVIAVDPVAFKRDSALLLGATHTADTMREASALAKSFTNGQGADVAIVTVGVLEGRDVGQAFAAIRKQGTVVVSAVGTMTNVGVPIPLGELTFYEKQLKGSLYGSCNPNADIPLHLELYRAGRLKLAELITNTYHFEDIAVGFDDLHAGKNIRGVVVFDETP
jgi:S-(hydroxymethyl)glutathione dehydrogenase/alcohol dehydrogenase